MATRPLPPKRPSRLLVALAFAVAIGAALALVAVALVFRDSGSSTATATTPVVDLTGIPQKGNVLGDPAAGVTLIEYADPQCPACRYFAESIFPTLVSEYVQPGKVQAEFRGFPFIGPDSVKALQFIYAAGLQGKLWQFQEALYRNQGGENDGWVTDELLRQIAGDIPGLDVDRLFADAQSDTIVGQVNALPGKAQAAGIQGTPSLFIKIGTSEPYYIQVASADEMRAALDDALAG